MLGSFHRLIIERPALATATAARLRRWAEERGVPVQVEEREASGRATPDFGIEPSKRCLRVVRHAGAALKPCTGLTDSLLCCNLHVLTQTVGCPLDCSYCILQDYQNRSQITIQADPGEILDQLSLELAAEPQRLFRVCTGQVADSLALEPEVGFTAEAVERFAHLENALLELKTKTDRVDFLLGLSHGGRTIVSWSLNPDEVARTEEHGAASLKARLRAAQRVVEAGYLVAFHLDPMIALQDDEQRYCRLVEQCLQAVPTARIAYLSMGTVRYLPAMGRTIAARFPQSKVTLAELLPDVDGKVRLLAPRRIELYRQVAQVARRICPELFIYLCMEPARIWRQSLGSGFQTRQEVEQAMSQSLQSRFGFGKLT